MVAEQSTFVKIDRNILRWRWYQDGNTMRVFLHLILKANIEDHDFEKITVHRGEIVTSIPSLCHQLKLSERKVRTALEHLKATGEVSCRNYPHYQVISIAGYDEYQSKVSGRTSDKRQANDMQTSGKRHQSKNVRSKEGKNEKNVCVAHTPDPAEVSDFFRARGRSSQDADKFFAYNNARGWKIGRNLIEDWHSAAEIWMAQAEDVGGRNRDEDNGLDEWGKPIRKEFQ